MRPPPLLRRSFYGAEGHRLNMDVDPRLSSILSAIEGHPRAVNAFMDFLHSLQVEKQASHQAAQRFEAFAERMQEEMRGLKEAIRELSGSLHYSRAFAPRIDVLPAPARQLPRPRKTKPKTKRRKHR
jgi:hypothetical protein